jgi:hypothetical protein
MIASSINTDIATGVAALPKAGGAMTGPITTNSTFDGVDIGVRDAILTSTTTTANAALPKAGGTMTGVIAGFESTGIDDNSNATAITIDSSENVLVGKTTIAGAFNTVGTELRETGLVQSTVDGSKCIDLNRKSSDGAIIGFSKDGASKGSIGVTSTGAYITLGGTGAANTLDDYEEGTWTPTIGGNSTYNNQVGRYIKIGNMVWVNFAISINAQGSGSTISQISGLPFTSGLASQNTSNLTWHGLGVAMTYGVYYVGANSTTLSLSYTTGASTQLTNNPNSLVNGAGINGTFVYTI